MRQRACHGCDKGELAFQIPWIRNVYKSLQHNLQGESAPYKETRNWWHRNYLLKKLNRVFFDFTISSINFCVSFSHNRENNLFGKVEKYDQNNMNSEAL